MYVHLYFQNRHQRFNIFNNGPIITTRYISMLLSPNVWASTAHYVASVHWQQASINFLPYGAWSISFLPFGVWPISFLPYGVRHSSFLPYGVWQISFLPYGVWPISFLPYGVWLISFLPYGVWPISNLPYGVWPISFLPYGVWWINFLLYDVWSISFLPYGVWSINFFCRILMHEITHLEYVAMDILLKNKIYKWVFYVVHVIGHITKNNAHFTMPEWITTVCLQT